MQDTFQQIEWDLQNVLHSFKDTKLDSKIMKTKLDRIYQITSYTEQQHQGDVYAAYCWIKLATQVPLSQFIANEKSEKYFLQEFISVAIKNMIICKQFSHKILMILTQHLMKEGLNVFIKYYHELQKYPKMISILKTIFNHDKPFYRMNYSFTHSFFVFYKIILDNSSQEQQINQINEFIENLSIGDKVDALKMENHSKRLCWLPGTVKKISNVNIYVQLDNEKIPCTFQRKSLKLAPFNTYKKYYDWRFQLKEGDFVDFQDSSGKWCQPKILQKRNLVMQNTEDNQVTIQQVNLGLNQQKQYWISITDPCLQKYQSIIPESNYADMSHDQHYFYVDDFNDLLFDPEATHFILFRSEMVRFELYVQLLQYAHKKLDIFGLLQKSIEMKEFGIQVISQIIHFISIVHCFIHRKHAYVYINYIINAILEYINNLDEQAIRNFSKQCYEMITFALKQFLKRFKTSTQRKIVLEKFQIQLIEKFLFSQVLNRKLQAVSILASLVKKKMMFKDIIGWIKEKEIIAAIYNDKSHSQLINRSKQFLELYLMTNPTVQDLAPLLQWNQQTIKLISENFMDFPQEFQAAIVQKIKGKQKVSNKYALEIIKKTINCQSWLLKNGGQCWVQVVKDKQKKRADIIQAFTMDFAIVFKITVEVANLYECRFRNQFFLYANEINYLANILNREDIEIKKKLDFAILLITPLDKISHQTFLALLPLTRQINDSLPSSYQQFFVKMLNKLNQKEVFQLFETNFQEQEKLKTIGDGQFKLFQKLFLIVNEKNENIKRNISYKMSNTHNFKKEAIYTYEINVNPKELQGMEQLMLIVFQNKSISVAEKALKLIEFLFQCLNSQLAESAIELRKNFLSTCLQRLYTTDDQQQKYLKIIEKIMNESQKQGCDKQPTVAALYPSQILYFKIIDHFNVYKRKILMKVDSNLTLHQFRGQLGRYLNAHMHEMKILHNNQELDSRLNGHVLHTLNLNEQLIIQKRVIIDKVTLIDHEGNLNKKVKMVFAHIFNEFSTMGMMSKQQCQKYQQKCVGDVSSLGESRIEQIYQTYDTDKDGFLKFQDFLNFYENAVKNKQSTVWQNLQSFGVRNDLEILTNQPIIYQQPDKLTRNILFKDQKFMTKLFELLHSESQGISQQAWLFLLRLPIYKQDFQLDLSKLKPFRYWLLANEAKEQYDNFNKQILEKIFEADRQTLCIGLKVAMYANQFDEKIFNRLSGNLIEVTSLQNLTFQSRIILDYSLRLLHLSLQHNKEIREKFIQQIGKNELTLSSGLLSTNHEIRTMFCQAVWKIVETSTQDHWIIFEVMFKMVYKNFQSMDKSTLHIEYFDLFSKFLEKLRQNENHMKKLGFNQQMLTEAMIKQYSEHKSLEESLNSPPDQIAQGFLRIIRKLVSKQNLKQLAPFVKYIFQQSLFPESGLHKLKNAKSRKDAYNLIYQICRLKNQQGASEGLKQLFSTEFKKIYKKMSDNKTSYYNFSYYSFNEARSQLGYCGIRNLGCICYMISMMQQLFMTASFRYLTLMADDKKPPKLAKKGSKQIDDNIFHQLQNCFANLELSERQQYNPEEFCFAFKDIDGSPVNVTIQQDAQQFLNIFFDRIENSLKETPFSHILQNIFGGKSCSVTVCSNCKAINQRFQNFYPLSLQVKGHPTIYHSFNKFIQGQIISDYQCDFCNKKTDVTKSCFISKAPDNFIIHLQRICFNYDRLENQKINSRFEFPHQLDIYDYSLKKQKNQPAQLGEFQFRLKGIVVHYGSADFGHYFSYIKVSQNQWVEFNDQRVRQFDPRDIQLQCFGGQHWRREHQNAYLLVYEKIKQNPIKLQFIDQREKQETLSKYRLTQVKTQIVLEQQIKEKFKQKNETQQQIKQKKQEKPKLINYIQSKKIKPFIPEQLASKINKANQQFSFTINLSNDQFAYFLYQVLSIDPPQSLKIQYLQLCYECFQLKQILTEQGNTVLSEWAANRFKQIVKGHGWEFIKIFGQHWQRDIISIEKTTRVGMKTVLQSTITDIIKNCNLQNLSEESQQDQKCKMVLEFLQKLLGMMQEEVSKQYFRWQQYFKIWERLIQESQFVRKFLQRRKAIQKIMRVIAEDHESYPSRFTSSAQYEYPLNMLTLLIKYAYEPSEKQKEMMKTYSFLNRVIHHPSTNLSLVQFICKDNQIMSEKMAYLILYSISKVAHSDYAKPIITNIHQFLSITDKLQKKRIQWIIGFPQYVQHPRLTSYGVYKINPDQENIVQFISPVSLTPILQLAIKMKNKYSHVATLIISMLLQLQSDQIINNLDDYPSVFAYELIYTNWFQEFINKYYEQHAQYSYNAKCYEQYAKRLKYLWVSRPNRPKNNFFYLIGRSIQKRLLAQTIVAQILQVSQFDIQCAIAPLDQKSIPLTKKIINKLPNNDNFIPKPNSYTSMSYAGRVRHSSDQQQQPSKQISNPFVKSFTATIFKQYVIKNKSNDSWQIVFGVVKNQILGSKLNIFLPMSQFSTDIRPQSYCVFTLLKKQVDKEFGIFELKVQLLGKSAKVGYWPSSIITPINYKKIQQDLESEEEEDSIDN